MIHSGKVAVVTGAAQGIGYAYAERFVADGAKVVVADVQDVRGEEAARRLGPAAAYRHCDVTSKADCAALMAFAAERFGGLDICVANAGLVHHADVLDVELADWNRVMAVNLKGVFLTGQAAANVMVRLGRGGTIVNIASTNALLGNFGQIPYAASKGAVNGMIKSMALALADHGIRVVGIGPGSVRTPMLDEVWDRIPGMREMVLARTPMGRVAEPSEVAAVASFLASDDASYLTGQTVYVEGGRLALNYMMPAKGGEAK